jgi:hypothetical protein
LDIAIGSLHVEPTETTLAPRKNDFTVFRMDFKATITLPNQEKKVVLIEIQKAKFESDIMRFRKYLGSQYMDSKNTYPENPKKAIPIQTIYFLGTSLKNITDVPIIRVTREYIDHYHQSKIAQQEDFIECLSHDSVIIQIPLFKQYRRNRLEKLLSIFEASTRHVIEVDELEEEEFEPIMRRLYKANADDQIRVQMDVEDEILQELADKDRFIANMAKQVEDAKIVKEEALKEKEEALKEKEEAQKLLKIIVKDWQNEGMSLEQISVRLKKSIGEIEGLLE